MNDNVMLPLSDFASIRVGDVASLTRHITESEVRRFVDLTGDNNPLHVDAAFAETTPFKGVVVHGMLGASFISTVIGTKLPGPGALWVSQSLDFRMPVRLGDVLRVSCRVTRKFERERLLELDVRILNQDDQLVLSGVGRVKMLEETTSKPKPRTSAAVALVTGGAGGIGTAVCMRLAKSGYSVVVNYRSSEIQASRIVQAINDAGGRAIAVAADVANPDEVSALVSRTLEEFGAIGLLVNAAAPKIGAKAFADLSWPDMMRQIDAQLKGAFYAAKAVVPAMREQGSGSIVCITSQAADVVPTPTWTAYTVAKASVAAFARSLAIELGPSGIRVNCVSPSMTDTAMIADIPEKARLIIARQTPLRRLATPDDVAAAVAFLASEDANFITGETLRVNGGQVML